MTRTARGCPIEKRAWSAAVEPTPGSPFATRESSKNFAASYHSSSIYILISVLTLLPVAAYARAVRQRLGRPAESASTEGDRT